MSYSWDSFLDEESVERFRRARDAELEGNSTDDTVTYSGSGEDCDGSCSSMDTVAPLVPHEKVEADFEKALGRSWYSRFLERMEKNHPWVYRFLTQ